MVEFLFVILVITLIYFFLKQKVFNKNYLTVAIFSIFFVVFIVVLHLDNITKNDNITYAILIIAYSFVLGLMTSLFSYFNKDKLKYKVKRYKTIKMYKIMFLTILIIYSLILALMFLIDQSFNSFKIINIVLFSLFFIFNILYNIYFLVNKVKGESVIVVTVDSYVIYDVSSKYIYRLDKILADKTFLVDKTIVGLYKDELTINQFIRVFYLKDYNLNNSDFNKHLHSLLVNWQSSSIIISTKIKKN